MAQGSGLMAHGGSWLRAHGGSWLRAHASWGMAYGVALMMLTTAALHATTRAVEQEPCAPARLTETGLYAAGSGATLAAGLRAFSPRYPLWPDGATKARWIYRPRGTAIDSSTPGDWTFPGGT